jgi:hypothetical protein
VQYATSEESGMNHSTILLPRASRENRGFELMGTETQMNFFSYDSISFISNTTIFFTRDEYLVLYLFEGIAV